MGNCQAAEAATVVIQHPGNKIERIYWSVSARQVMDSNPGHYVAHVIHSSTTTSTPSNHFKLLRPNDTLLIGQLYRLISFQDVLQEFAAKKCVKLGKLLMNRGALGVEMKHKDFATTDPNPSNTANKVELGGEVHGMRSSSSKKKKNKGGGGGGQQWKPALQSIAEFGT